MTLKPINYIIYFYVSRYFNNCSQKVNLEKKEYFLFRTLFKNFFDKNEKNSEQP